MTRFRNACVGAACVALAAALMATAVVMGAHP